MDSTFEKLYVSVRQARTLDPAVSRTARLFRDGRAKMVKKLAEEAIEVGIEALQDKRQDTILETADLLYQLCALLADMGIEPVEICKEICRREQLYGIAEKLPKGESATLKSVS